MKCCMHCKAEIKTNKRKHAVYCSNACKSAEWRKNKLESVTNKKIGGSKNEARGFKKVSGKKD